jgi:hypothetical protein
MSSQSPRAGNDAAGSVVCQRGFDETEGVTTNILLALDSLPEFDAESSEGVIFEHVDPDALDALFRSAPGAGRTQGSVNFPVGDYRVSVCAQGDVVVWDPSG